MDWWDEDARGELITYENKELHYSKKVGMWKSLTN